VWASDLGEMEDDANRLKNGLFGSLITFSVIAIFTGIFGMSCVCKPCRTDTTCTRIYIVVYGAVLTLVWLVYMIIGGTLVGTAHGLPTVIQDVCDGKDVAGSTHI